MRRFAKVNKFVWIERQYEIDFNIDDHIKAKHQMDNQKEHIDDTILIEVRWNAQTNRALITDKIKEYEKH